PTVLSAAGAGDPIAHETLSRAGHELANTADIAIQRLFPQAEDFSIATHGGIFSSSELTRNAFVQRLESQYGARSKWLSREVDPARGALVKARRGFEA
ncbi:MAG TPA: hypothetical protein VIL63_09220, partial [Terriglobales bacterium]